MWERLDHLLTEVSSRVCCQVFIPSKGMVLTLGFLFRWIYPQSPPLLPTCFFTTCLNYLNGDPKCRGYNFPRRVESV